MITRDMEDHQTKDKDSVGDLPEEILKIYEELGRDVQKEMRQFEEDLHIKDQILKTPMKF